MNKSTVERIKKNINIEKIYKLAKTDSFSHAILLEWTNFEKNESKLISLLKILICNINNCNEKNHTHNNCEVCVKIEKKIHPDVIYIEKFSSNTIGIEEIRKVRKSAYIAANEAKHKVYIIKNGEFLTLQAQNAFLKILEEPPKNVIFILICKNYLNLLKTVISRFQIFCIDNDDKNQFFLDENLENIANNCFQAILKRSEFALFVAISEINKHKSDLISINNKVSRLVIKNASEFSAITVISILEILKEVNSLSQKNINNNLLLSHYFSLIKKSFSKY